MTPLPPDAQSIRLSTASRLKAAQYLSPLVRNLFRRGQWVRSQRLKASGSLLAAVTLILLLAAGLRFHLLGAQSFWNDEGSSYVQAMRSFTEIAANAGRDIHPPGYYWLLAGWRLLVGTSEFALRSLSVFASLLSIAFAAALGRRLFGWAAAVTAALLIALNTFSIYYAQEARMYALLALWSAAGMWALAGFLRRPTWRWALLLALFNAAGLWTQYAYPFVMLAQGGVAVVWLAIEPRRGEFQTRPYRLPALLLYVAANLLTILLYLPWLSTSLQQVTGWPNTGDATLFDQALKTVLLWLTLGIASSGAPLAIPIVLLSLGLLVLQRRTIWTMVLPAAWVVVPVGLFLALGLFRPDNVKLLLPAQIGMALWIGRGVSVLGGLKPRYGRRRDFATRLGLIVPPVTALVSVVWLALAAWEGVPALYADPAYQRSDYRAIVRTIEADSRPGDAVILDAPNQEEVFRYYYRGDAAIYPLPQGLGGDDAATASATTEVVRAHPRIFAVFWGEGERDPQRVVETTLSRQAYEIDSQWYGDVRLVRYAAPTGAIMMQGAGVRFGDHITLVGYGFSGAALSSGDALQVSLDWRTDAPLDRRYKVFLQLLDASGALAAQRDSEPGAGLTPTTTWTPGQEIADWHGLLLDLPPGDYQLIVGLYALVNPAERLPVSSGGDFMSLGTITVNEG